MAPAGITTEKFNQEKFVELLLYVASRLAGDPHNGVLKRNKAIAFADFNHYAKYGQSITGATYLRQPFGPAPVGIRQIEHDLVEKGDAAEVIIGFGPKAQKLLFRSATRELNLDLFSGSEMASVDAALELLADKTGMESSDLAHEKMLGWQYAGHKRPIPYETVFLYDGPVTDDERLAAKELVADLGSVIERVLVAAAPGAPA